MMGRDPGMIFDVEYNFSTIVLKLKFVILSNFNAFRTIFA